MGARLLSAFPEVMIILHGILMATRAVFVTLLLLSFTIYVFAILFTQLCAEGDLGNDLFKNVPASMYTLLIKGNLPDLDDMSQTISDHHPLLMVVFLVFVFFSALTLLNMLVGILVDVVQTVAAT